ncbi:unnamed protein product [Protopolystoma xenopodis]|uniref:Uncharacterized protein n=1 Tax=Protopolystoma xenopodis TaxID=117903 RepID=A0A3S5C483_9PLAT|nr:unnamed protein product [Protopolystoma xenopodis]
MSSHSQSRDEQKHLIQKRLEDRSRAKLTSSAGDYDDNTSIGGDTIDPTSSPSSTAVNDSTFDSKGLDLPIITNPRYENKSPGLL